MEKHQINFTTSRFQQHGWIWQYPESERNSEQRLVLIHGAGVAGELTWTYLANYLDAWQEILVLDLAGMGSEFLQLPDAPQVNDYALQLAEVLEALDWTQFDLAGYSFGGMVAVEFIERYFRSLSGETFNGLLFLLEPAMLFSAATADLAKKAQEYQQIAAAVRANPEDVEVYRAFLDSVSPARRQDPASDRLTMKRLSQRPQSFAAVLQAVSQQLMLCGDNYRHWQSPYSGMSFVGGLSPGVMKQRHQQLQHQSRDWQFVEVPGADHSLVFTKPRGIARRMNERKRPE